MRGSDYAELRALVAVADHRAFGRAAAHLGVSPSALSQTIRRLEERLGVRLLNRTTRSVAPTESGETLLARVRPLFAELDAVVDTVSAQPDHPSGRLRINTTRLAATHHIAPVLGRFLTAWPDIKLDLVVEDRLVDIVAGGFDAGVRLGERVEKDMIAIPIGGDVRMRVVASRDYLTRHGEPLSPRDLNAHRCINYRQPTDQSVYRWEFERDGEKLEVSVDGALTVNAPELVLPAVLDGLGFAYLFEHLIGDLIQTGRLVSVLDDWTPPFPGFYLYYTSRRQMPPALRAFIDVMRATP